MNTIFARSIFYFRSEQMEKIFFLKKQTKIGHLEVCSVNSKTSLAHIYTISSAYIINIDDHRALMSIIESLDLLPSIKDLVIPTVVAVIYWLLKKVILPTIQGLANWFKRLRIKELKRAKKIRLDPFSIQRQLAKESALFNTFLLSAVVSLGLMLIVIQTSQPFGVTVVLFIIYMAPVVVMEVWWLWHKAFIDVLLEEASRLGASFRRISVPRVQSPLRIKNRKIRQEVASSKLLSRKKLVARRLV